MPSRPFIVFGRGGGSNTAQERLDYTKQRDAEKDAVALQKRLEDKTHREKVEALAERSRAVQDAEFELRTLTAKAAANKALWQLKQASIAQEQAIKFGNELAKLDPTDVSIETSLKKTALISKYPAALLSKIGTDLLSDWTHKNEQATSNSVAAKASEAKHIGEWEYQNNTPVVRNLDGSVNWLASGEAARNSAAAAGMKEKTRTSGGVTFTSEKPAGQSAPGQAAPDVTKSFNDHAANFRKMTAEAAQYRSSGKAVPPKLSGDIRNSYSEMKKTVERLKTEVPDTAATLGTQFDTLHGEMLGALQSEHGQWQSQLETSPEAKRPAVRKSLNRVKREINSFVPPEDAYNLIDEKTGKEIPPITRPSEGAPSADTSDSQISAPIAETPVESAPVAEPPSVSYAMDNDTGDIHILGPDFTRLAVLRKPVAKPEEQYA